MWSGDVILCRMKTRTLKEKTPYFISLDLDTLNNFEDTVIDDRVFTWTYSQSKSTNQVIKNHRLQH
jgi:hypothetical protein